MQKYNDHGLLARARELLQSHANGAALVIVPLAMAVPATADLVAFNYNFDPGSSFVTNGISGGALGTVGGSAVNSGMGLHLTGDSTPPDLRKGLPTIYAPTSMFIIPDTPLGFQWSGGFDTPGPVNLNNLLAISYQICFQGFPANATSSSVGTVNWIVQFDVFDFDGNPLLAYSSPGNLVPFTPLPGQALQSGLSDKVSGSDTATFTAGTPYSWIASVIVNWNFPTQLDSNQSMEPVNADDQLKVTPTLDIFGTNSAAATNAVPLPSSLGISSLLLAVVGAGCYGKGLLHKFARKTSARA